MFFKKKKKKTLQEIDLQTILITDQTVSLFCSLSVSYSLSVNTAWFSPSSVKGN